MKPEQIKDILHQHSLWLVDKSTGRRADFGGRDLQGVYFGGKDLHRAIFAGADLRCASFVGAGLQEASFAGADLRCVDFTGANLRDVAFIMANLQDVNFDMAKLDGCYFRGANLERASGIKWADCSFASHGEMGRRLLAVMINDNLVYFCGCFEGDEAALRKYIAGDLEDEGKKYKPSRLFALEFVKNAINETFNHGA